MPTETACRRSQLACFLARLSSLASSPRTEPVMLASSASMGNSFNAGTRSCPGEAERPSKAGDEFIDTATEAHGDCDAQPGRVRASSPIVTAVRCVVIISSSVLGGIAWGNLRTRGKPEYSRQYRSWLLQVGSGGHLSKRPMRLITRAAPGRGSTAKTRHPPSFGYRRHAHVFPQLPIL